MLGGLLTCSARLFAVLALLLGLIAPAHAGPPLVAPIIEVQPAAPDVQLSPIVRVYLVAYRAHGPPSSAILILAFVRGMGVSACPGYRGGWTDGVTGLQRFGARWYAPGQGRFVSEDPAKAGNAWYAWPSDPVNQWDPSGLDEVWFDDDGKVYWQRETHGYWWDSKVGDPIEIGTSKDGHWARIHKKFGGGMIDKGTLKYHANKTYSGDSWSNNENLAMAMILWEAKGDDRIHMYTPGIDMAEGALRVAYEPAGLVKTGVEAIGAAATIPFGGRRLSSNDMRRDGWFPDSSLFTNAGQRLDEGASRTRVGWEVGRDIATRGNPATGIPLAAIDAYQGAKEGDHAKVGGSLAGLAMYAAPMVPGAYRSFNVRFARIEVQMFDPALNITEVNAVARSPILGRRLSAFENNSYNAADGVLHAGKMYTLPGYRGMGLGERLFSSVLNAVEEQRGPVNIIESFLIKSNMAAYRRGGMSAMPAVKIRQKLGYTFNEFDPETQILRSQRPFVDPDPFLLDPFSP